MGLVYPQIVTGADLLRGICKLSDLAPLLKERGATSAAIVNSNLYGVRSFYQVLKKYDIQPIIGLSVKVDIGNDQSVLIYAYARNEMGYRNLLKMSSAIEIRDTENLPLQWLTAYSADCYLVLSPTDVSWDSVNKEEVVQLIIEHGHLSAVSLIGISRPGGHQCEDEQEIERVADSLNLQIVAVYEALFVQENHLFAYQVANAIRSGEKLSDIKDDSLQTKYAYLPDESELASWFKDKLDWLENTSDMLANCVVKMDDNPVLMPAFPVSAEQEVIDVLKSKCVEGLNARLGAFDDVYKNRLEYELKVINEMGYADYFLIVEDFMHFATENSILTGPGRGSSAGSLVAFSLYITDVDPIKYGLIFERFLNPERVTMPDIDIDFADDRRQEVIQYVVNKYGKSYVSQIITFGTLSAKSVARNVGRVFNFANEEMSFVSNEIPNRGQVTLESAFNESEKLRNWVSLDPLRDRWYEAAKILEGLPRNASTHAAGVILSPIPLVDTVPLQLGTDGIYLTQWAMKDVEEVGLLKMDFLGLRNLTLLNRIQSMVYYDKKEQIDLDKIPLDDQKTFELFKKADMTGIFQFESSGMRDTLKLIQPDRFEDLFAINALYRPGPMDYIPVYERRKHGKEKISYVHPVLEPILKETYGVIVYQEQIMQIASSFASYSMGEADLLRRAISKKKRDLLESERAKFIERAVEKGTTKEIAVSVYDLIVKFADYGFPKSHAVAYSLISYRLAFLKANEPAYFFAALLSSMTGSDEKTALLIQEAKSYGIHFLSPSIQKSKYAFTVENGAIRIGLGSIKGITGSFYQQLNTIRKAGAKWKTMFDFSVAIGSEFFVEKFILPLIKSGSMDEFGEERAVLLASIDAGVSHALFNQPAANGDLLAPIIHSIASPKYTPSGEMPRMTMLEYEREVLGFYLSEHPVVQIKKTAREEISNLAAVSNMESRKVITVIGLITEIKRIRTKKGEAMAFVTIQDETGFISCTYFPKQYVIANVHLSEMAIVIVEGTVENRKGTRQVLVQKSNTI